MKVVRFIAFTVRTSLAAGVAVGSLAACGGSAPTGPEAPASPETSSPATPSPDAEAGEVAAEEGSPNAFPTKCAKAGALCAPPTAFVKKLCSGFHPDVALAMFANGTPWTRGYLAANVEAWNASGGASSQDKLKFDEEVLLLLHRAADKSGIQVSGAGGSYDVLRWDGTCATLSEDEVTLNEPPRKGNAKVTWKDLGADVRAVMLEDQGLYEINKARKDECKGVTMGAVSKKCVQLVDKQSQLIVDFVRGGGSIPTPAPLP